MPQRGVALAMLAMLALLLAPAGRPLPVAAATFDRAGAVARAIEHSPEAGVDREAIARASEFEQLAGAYPFNPRVEVEGAGGAHGSGFRLGVSQELDTRGEGGARKSVARAESQLTQAAANGHAHALGRRTEEAVSRVLLARRRVALADSFAVASDRIVQSARRAARAEAISGFTLRQIELDDARVRDRGTVAEAELRQSEALLREILLLPPDEPLDLEDDLDDPLWRCAPDSLAQVAVQTRHEVLEATALEDMRTAETGLAAREGRPGPEVRLFVEHERDLLPTGHTTGPSLADEHIEHRAWMVGAGLELPLPLFQKNAWSTSRSGVEAARAGAVRRRIESRVPIEVRAACERLDLAQAREQLLAASLGRSREDRVPLEAAYREGRIDLESYLAQRNRLLEAAEAHVDALAETEDARIDLARVTGLSYADLARALDLRGGKP